MGIVATATGMVAWVNPKFREQDKKIEAVNDRINGKADILHGRITAVERLLVELEANHKTTVLLYKTTAEGLKDLNQKTDDQTKILHEVVGELKSIQRKRDDL